MIEIGKNFLFGLASAKQTARTEKEKYKTQAGQADELVRKLQQDYEDATAYLFRSSAEKIRLANQQAREALARRQARRAAHGVSGASSVQDENITQDVTQLTASKEQTQLQHAAAQEENRFKTKWQDLLKTSAAYRIFARKSNARGSLAGAIGSLFK